jgi:DNA repair protein RecO (recombination protein O)
MSALSTPAILLRRIQHGDADLILTLLTAEAGKMSVIAKHAKKSSKRFAGMLELFSEMTAVVHKGRGKLPVLQEATLLRPHDRIRSDIRKTAYASFWAETVNAATEEGKPQMRIYRLLAYVLGALDSGRMPSEEISILFLMRFLNASGLSPDLETCTCCHTRLDAVEGYQVAADISKGGVVCLSCRPPGTGGRCLSKGTLKKLMWVGHGDPAKAERIRFNGPAIREGLSFLETFVSFHLGRELKSLTFLRGLRNNV